MRLLTSHYLAAREGAALDQLVQAAAAGEEAAQAAHEIDEARFPVAARGRRCEQFLLEARRLRSGHVAALVRVQRLEGRA